MNSIIKIETADGIFILNMATFICAITSLSEKKLTLFLVDSQSIDLTFESEESLTEIANNLYTKLRNINQLARDSGESYYE